MLGFSGNSEMRTAGITGMAAAVVAAVLVGGCAGLMQVRFPVSPSGLDYVNFVQHRAMADGRLYTVKLELQGGGLLTYQAGTSQRVRDGFWQPSDDATWNDLRTDQKMLPEAFVQQTMQRIVDAGTFDRGRDVNPDGLAHPLFIQARIGREKRIFLTEEPAFVSIYDGLVDLLVR